MTTTRPYSTSQPKHLQGSGKRCQYAAEGDRTFEELTGGDFKLFCLVALFILGFGVVRLLRHRSRLFCNASGLSLLRGGSRPEPRIFLLIPEAVFFLFLPLCQFLEVLVRIGNPIFRHNQSGLDPFLVKEFLSRGSSHRHGGRWIDQIAGSSPYCHNVDNASHCIYTSSPRFCHLNC